MSTSDLPPDRHAQRAWLVALATLPEGGTAVDLGCGRGEDVRLLAARHPGPGVRLVGLDASQAAIAAATAATADPRVSFMQVPLDEQLPFADV